MKIAMRQVGNTLVELTVAMAITGIVAVPLTGIMSQQLSVPGKISRQVITDQQDLKSSGIFAADGSRAQSFTPGEEPPVYGTFSLGRAGRTIPRRGNCPVCLEKGRGSGLS